MIPSFIRQLFTLNYQYDNIIQHQRTQRLLQINGIILIVSVIWFIFLGLPELVNGGGFWGNWVIPLVSAVVSIILYNLIQRGQALWSARIFVLFIFVASVPFTNEFVASPLIANAMLPLVLTGVLLDRQALRIVTISILLIIIQTFAFGNITTSLDTIQIISLMIAIALSGLFLGLTFNIIVITY